MKKQKYYVVWKGRVPGIYLTWDECKQQTDCFQDAAYKSFKTIEEAGAAFNNEHIKPALNKNNTGRKASGYIPESISVDAAWNTKTGFMEYQGVITNSKKKLFAMGPFPDATNNIGEFLAVVHALALQKKKGSNYPVYTDSITAMKWVKTKKCNTRLIKSTQNEELFNLIQRAEQWLSENPDIADVLKWDTAHWGEIPADYGRK